MFQKFLAKHLRKPEGVFGRFLLGKLDRLNDDMTSNAVDVLRPRDGERVLDIGFGGGALFRKIWKEAPGARLCGADFSADVVAKGNQKFRRELADGRLELHAADVAALPFEDAVFDVVTTVNCVYFWPDSAAALGEIFRVLKPGGRVGIVYRSGRDLKRFGATQHGFRLYEPDELENLLRAAGFQEVRTESRPEKNGMTSRVTLGSR